MAAPDPFLGAVLTSLLPGDGTWPSATSTGLPSWFGDRAAKMPALADAVAWLRSSLPANFTTRAPAEREADLRSCEAKDPHRFSILTTEAFNGYYIDPAVLSVIEGKTGFPARPPQPTGHRLPPFDFSIIDGRKGPVNT
ncbi:MAG: hypothetical protein JNL04_09650 [Rhodospirillaceae bacterium]|nr:hypothetical protein [Rhodospirillaceae bacterium]